MKNEYLSIWNLVLLEEEAVLDRFHLRLSRGDFVEMLGTEGAGKTSVASFFCGRSRIGSGFVRVDGHRIPAGETYPSDGIECIGPVPSVAESLSVAENVMLLSHRRRIHGLVHHTDLERRTSFLLSEMGLPFRADAPVHMLTEGEKRAVELMRVVQNETPFLFVDDIFSTLGQEDMQMIGTCLHFLKERGVTILVLGSGMPHFQDMSDRVVVMRGGRNVRTFYKGSFDRGEYVRWMFGVTDPASVRAEAVSLLGGRSGHAPAVRTTDGRNGGAEEKKGTVIFRAEGVRGSSDMPHSFEVCGGEIVGLYDMNNRANREIIRLVTGETPLEDGAFYLKGEPFHPSTTEHAIRCGIGYIPREIGRAAAVPRMSYGENLALPVMRRKGVFALKNRRVVRFLSSEYGKEMDGDVRDPSFMKELTQRDRMRIVMQRMLLMRPALLLIEDVISDMNVGMLKIQTEYLARLTGEGCAVLISSPNLQAIRQVCDRIVVLNI